MSVLAPAPAPALAGWRPPADDAAALRALAAQVEEGGQRQEAAARRLGAAAARLLHRWRGTAARAAGEAIDRLLLRAADTASAHAAAAEVLRICAARVEEAQALWGRAQSAEQRDAADRAARARAAARGAFVGPFDVDDSPLRRHARQLAAEAAALGAAARAHAAEELHVLASAAPTGPARPRRLDLGDHLSDAASAAGDATWGAVVTAAGLTLPRLLADPDGWTDQVLGTYAGARYAVEHPGEAARAMTGWDLLADGRYGAWVGGLAPDLLAGAVSAGSVPAARRGADASRQLAHLAEDAGPRARPVDRFAVLRPPVPGGPVRPRPGALMTGRYPRAIRPLTGERQRHILIGDPPPSTKGGHASGAGRKKSEFPPSWTHDDIIRRVMETATRPYSTADQPDRPNLLAHAEHDGVCVRVAVDPDGRVVTGYPISGKAADRSCGGRSTS